MIEISKSKTAKGLSNPISFSLLLKCCKYLQASNINNVNQVATQKPKFTEIWKKKQLSDLILTWNSWQQSAYFQNYLYWDVCIDFQHFKKIICISSQWEKLFSVLKKKPEYGQSSTPNNLISSAKISKHLKDSRLKKKIIYIAGLLILTSSDNGLNNL